MRLTRLLTQTVTVHRRVEGGTDEYGNPTPGWADPADVAGRLEQMSGEEVVVGRDMQMADWRLFLAPDVVLAGRDQVEVDGVEFEVDGPPAIKRDIRGRAHHIEARLRSVEW